MKIIKKKEREQISEIRKIRNSIYLIIAAIFIYLIQTLTVMASETDDKVKQVSENRIENADCNIHVSIDGIDDGMIYANKVGLNLKATCDVKSMIVRLNVRYRDKSGQIRELDNVENNVHGREYTINRIYSEAGIYEISFYAKQKGGEASDNRVVSFAIDNEPPVIDFRDVNNGGKYGCRKEIAIGVSDSFADGLTARVEILREEDNGKIVCTTPEYICQASNNTNIYSLNDNGKYTVTVHANDFCNNEAVKTISFTIDTAPPTIDVYSNGDELKESEILNKAPVFSIVIKDSAYEGGTAQIELLKKIKGENFEKVYSKGYTLTATESKVTLPVRDEGIYVLNVNAVDAFMNKTAKSYYFTLDESPPVIAYFSDFNEHYLKSFRLPENAKKYINDMTNVSYHAYLNEKETSGGSIKKDGKYILQIVAQDEAGNVSEEAIAFIVDNTKPTVIVSGLNADGDVDKNTDIKLSLFDDEDYFERVIVNGEELKLNQMCREAYIPVNEYGQYEINVCAADNADNRVEKTIVTNCKLLSKGPNITELSGNIKKLTKSSPENSVNNTSKKMSQRVSALMCVAASFITIGLVILAVFTFVDTNRKQC